MDIADVDPEVWLTLRSNEIQQLSDRLETALRNGLLTTCLNDADVLSPGAERVATAYRRINVPHGHRISMIRPALFASVLGEFARSLARPTTWFPAIGTWTEHSPVEREVAIPGADVEHVIPVRRMNHIRAEGPTGPVLLRIDQVIACRNWGIGFQLSEEEAAKYVTSALVEVAVRRLCSGLRDLAIIDLEWHPAEDRARFADSPSGVLFENLMLDILNEEALVARRAPLKEDFPEKTDLRVRPPDLVRKRGARVQVTQTTNPVQYSEKLSAIALIDELVVLSPIALARALAESSAGVELLGPADIDAFWNSFPNKPATVSALAYEMKAVFLNALSRPTEHPTGPLFCVPNQLRSLVRNYVFNEALRSTRVMREREKAETIKCRT